MLFGFSLITVTEVFAYGEVDAESFKECESMRKTKGAKFPYKDMINCFHEWYKENLERYGIDKLQCHKPHDPRIYKCPR
jgi:hypothetical protein